MGQPYWTKEEEDYFRDVIIPLSEYSTGAQGNSGRKFGELAPIMQVYMQSIGINKRTYTEQNLFQHWYQRYSARASIRRQNVSDHPVTVATDPNIVRTSATLYSTTSGSTPQQPRRVGTYVNHATQTKWTIAPGMNTDGDEENQEDGATHPSNIGHIHQKPLLSSTPPTSSARRVSFSQHSRESAIMPDRPWDDDEDEDGGFFDNSAQSQARSSAARQRIPARSAPKSTPRPGSYGKFDETDLEKYNYTPIKQRAGASKRFTSDPESASKRQKTTASLSTPDTPDETTQGQSQGEDTAAAGSPKVSAKKTPMTEALRQVILNNPAHQFSQNSSRLQIASPGTVTRSESRSPGVSVRRESGHERPTSRTQVKSTSPTGSVASIDSISSSGPPRNSTQAVAHTRPDLNRSPDVTRTFRGTLGNFRSQTTSGPRFPPTHPEGSQSYEYTPELMTSRVAPSSYQYTPGRMTSRASPPGLPPTRLSLNQPTFEESPGYSFYSPTGSSYYSPGSSNATPARGHPFTRTPDDYAVELEFPSTGRRRGRIIPPRRISPLKPASAAEEHAVDPESPSSGRSRKIIPPAPLFNGTPSKSGSEPLSSNPTSEDKEQL